MAQNKGNRSRRADSAAGQAGNAVSDSAQKIWLAGLGAFDRAKAEGPRMFENLVEQGKTLGGKARDAADEALKSMRDGRFDKLSKQVSDLTDDVRGLMRQQVGAASGAKRGSGKKKRAAGSKAKRGATVKRSASAKAGGVKRKAKRAVSKAKRSVAQRTRKARSKARK
jgi:poly(hydroxyalkanoate) granule-associated protein